MSTTVAWRVLTRVGRRIASVSDGTSVAFTAEPSPGIYTRSSLPVSSAYVPLTLIPTATYHQVIRNRLESLGFQWPSKKPPYRMPIPEMGDWLLSVRARIYSPNILSIVLRLTVGLDISLEGNLDNLLSLRFPLNISIIREIANLTAGMIDSGNHRHPTPGMRLSAYPGYHLNPVADGRDMPNLFTAEEKRLTALLLGIPHWRGISDDLVRSVITQNEELNKKATEEILLLNKQGLLQLTPSSRPFVVQPGRFDQMLDLVEIGRVFQYFLDDFLHIRLGQEDFADYIFAQIEAWVDNSAAIFSSSYTGHEAWRMAINAFRLTDKLALVKTSLPHLAEEIARKRQFFAQAADRWWEKPEFATVFDSANFRATSALARVNDADLRRTIVGYLREAEMSLAGRSFRSAVVMSGSAVEAMLLAVLERDTNLDPSSLRTKGLQDYIQLAKSNRLIPDVALLSLLETSLRDWRNFVHPGKALRTGVELTEDHARIAVTAANALAKAL